MDEIKPVVTMTERQYAIVAITMNRIKKDAYQCLWQLILLILATGVFLIVIGLEIAIAYGVFSGLLEGIEDPVVQHSAGLLSMTAVIVMLTYHWIARHYPDAWPVRLIRNLSVVFAPLYALAGGLFLSILLFPGAIATAATGTFDTIFGLPVEQVDAGHVGQIIVTWLQDNLVLAAPIFLAGVAGVSVMGLFVGGQCIDAISTNARTIFRALSNYAAARRAWMQLNASDKTCRKTGRELTYLEKRDDSFIRNQAAVMIAGLVDRYVQRAEAAIEANPALFTPIDEPDSTLGRLFGKQLDLSSIQTRIDILKTYNVKHIRGVIDRILK